MALRRLRVEAVAKPTAKAVRLVPAPRRLPLGLGFGAAPLLAAFPARAEDAVDVTVNTITEAIKVTGEAVKGGIEAVDAGVKVLQQGYEAASPYIDAGVKAVAPVVKGAVKATTEVAGPVVSKAVSSAVPVVQDTLTGAIKSSGVDLDAVTRTAGTAVKTAAGGATAAQPFLGKVWAFLTTTPPNALGEYALGAAALYLLAPTLLGAALGGLRGFAGELGAVQALEAVRADGGAFIVDIRSEREKEAAGVPDIPGGGGKLLEVEFASIDDRQLRGMLRDPGFIEAQVTALQVAALRRLGRGSKIILLDRNGSSSKAVARELAKRGYGRVFVLRGGFEGRDGWVSSKLLVKPAPATGSQFLFGGSQAVSATRTVSSRALPRTETRTLARTETKSLPRPESRNLARTESRSLTKSESKAEATRTVSSRGTRRALPPGKGGN